VPYQKNKKVHDLMLYASLFKVLEK